MSEVLLNACQEKVPAELIQRRRNRLTSAGDCTFLIIFATFFDDKVRSLFGNFFVEFQAAAVAPLTTPFRSEPARLLAEHRPHLFGLGVAGAVEELSQLE